MKYDELNRIYNQIAGYIAAKRLKDAFDALALLANRCENRDLKTQLDNHLDTYRNMLKYSFELTGDPEKEQVYNRLLKALTELADDMKEDIIINYNLLNYSNIKKKTRQEAELSETVSKQYIQQLNLEREIEQLLKESGSKGDAGKAAGNRKAVSDLFQLIWMTDKFQDTEIRLVSGICSSRSFPWYDKCVVVSALTLSLMRHFDSKKIGLLFDFFEASEHQVWQRALTGLITGLIFYDRRLGFYPEISQRLKAKQGDKTIEKYTEAVIIQFIKAKETEKITKRIQEEILPEMMKMKSKLEDKLDLEGMIPAENRDEKNPEWETFFKDSPDVYHKLEEFSNLQMEGADVFLGAFAYLKRFDFFAEISNWFLPFFNEHENVKEALSNVKEGFDVKQFAEGIERTHFLCNSDKYSFCLNVKHMPPLQKSTIMELFNMELKAMNEMVSEDEKINAELRDKAVFTQYFQDLYRFYKLHPLKAEFHDIFTLPLPVIDLQFFQILVDNPVIIRNIGEFYFEKNNYAEALGIFERIIDKEKDFELFEKIAFCHQKLDHYAQALEYYHKAEIMDSGRLWLIYRIAWCYKRTGNFEKAIEYYQRAGKLEPDNLQIQTHIGQAYMEMEDYETALKYFFKVEYSQPDNLKIQRPIGWCSFVLGKFDTARKYFEKTIASSGNKNDYLNLGHVEWCLGNKSAAIQQYKHSIKASSGDMAWFSKTMQEDSRYLINHGIKSFDIPLMIDYQRMSASS
ncbi:MAG: tetratricopeptide repeat protein [Bacteroidales bacterium]|nr:tetratricopeptide repeat protein [Bacteroidales bacterium]